MTHRLVVDRDGDALLMHPSDRSCTRKITCPYARAYLQTREFRRLSPGEYRVEINPDTGELDREPVE